MTSLLPWLIILPLGWACMAFWLGPCRGGRLAEVGLGFQLVLAATLLASGEGARLLHPVGGWGAPLGIDLHWDGLSGILLLLTQTLGLLLAVYARPYFAHDPSQGTYFWPLTGFLLAAMNGLLLSADLFNLYVALELLGLAAVSLVASPGQPPQVAAALRYLQVTMLGSGAYLLGVALVYGTYGSVALGQLTGLIATPVPLAIKLAAGLMLLGLLIKAALFPFHFWLPAAHGNAPAPVSALLSALVIKAGFYLILRLWMGIFSPLAIPSLSQLLGLLGTAAMVWGSLQALRQNRLKLLIAYSTVAQMGYLFLLFPLMTQTTPEAARSALLGAILLLLTHALAKAALFAAVGVMILTTGQDRLVAAVGLSSRLPVTLFSFALAGISLMGLPPSSGFLAKWLLVTGALNGERWEWAVIMLLGSLLTAAYLFRVMRLAFLPPRATQPFHPPARRLEWTALLLALASLLPGLRASELLTLLGVP